VYSLAIGICRHRRLPVAAAAIKLVSWYTTHAPLRVAVKPIFRDLKNSREPDLRDLPSLSKLRA